MKLGLVTPGWPGHNTPNGIATSVYHLAMGLQAIGHEPVILTPNIDGPLPDGIPVVDITPRPWTFVPKLLSRLGRPDVKQDLVAKGRADALKKAHALYGLDAVVVEESFGWANEMVALKSVPVIVFLHGPWILHQALQSEGHSASDHKRLAREAKLFKSARALVSPAHCVLQAVQDAVDVAHVPSAVIRNSFEQEAVDRPTAGNKILFVGRYDRHKGGDTVIAAFDRLVECRPDAALTFVGPDSGLLAADGSAQSITTALEALSEPARNGLDWVGRQALGEIAVLRQTHPIALIASRFENLNYTMLEAMAAGQALVATNVGGPAEVLEDGKTALLVPPNDPQAMADALERLIKDPDLAPALGQAARAKLKADFAPQTVAYQWIAFLEAVL